jgi:hypothetical protein
MKIRILEEDQTFSNIVTRTVTWGNLYSRKNEQEEFNIALCNPVVKANIPLKSSKS